MSVRLWRAFGLATIMACLTVMTVSAKGGYSFLTIAGPDLPEAVRTSDPALAEDFFAFADFYRDRVESPADPGPGYEITRYYMDGAREIAFDRLHYYPATGFVYYDGIINGSSEYDRKWYTADPAVRSVFEEMLFVASQKASVEKDVTNENVSAVRQPGIAFDRTEFILSFAIAAGITVTLLALFSRRKVASQ